MSIIIWKYFTISVHNVHLHIQGVSSKFPKTCTARIFTWSTWKWPKNYISMTNSFKENVKEKCGIIFGSRKRSLLDLYFYWLVLWPSWIPDLAPLDFWSISLLVTTRRKLSYLYSCCVHFIGHDTAATCAVSHSTAHACMPQYAQLNNFLHKHTQIPTFMFLIIFFL